MAEVSLASDGDKLSLAYATTHAIRVLHSATGYSNWSMPVDIATDANMPYLSGPAIAYWHGRLYAFYNKAAAIQLLMRRSDTFLGLSFTSPEVEVDVFSSFRRPAVVAADYSILPPEPDVVQLNQATEPAGHVNVIYVSENYIESELDQFRATVDESLAGFTLISPFRQNLSLLNIYRVDLRSRQSGTDRSPDLASAYSYSPYHTGELQPLYSDTALGSQLLGTFTDGSLDRFAEDPTVSPSAYVASGSLFLDVDHDFLNDLLSRVVPGYVEHRDIVYVVTQERMNTEKLAGNPLVSTAMFFRQKGFIHETGHSIGYLADEDKSNLCPPTERVNGDCGMNNQTINPDLRDPNHKWAHFFVDFDHDGVIDPGDSIVADVSPNWDYTVDGYSNYWEPGVSTFASMLNMGIWAAYNDDGWQSAGQPVYASSEQCLMNHSGAITKFCAVCAESIVRGLWTRAMGGWSEAQHQRFHDEYSRVYLEYVHQGSGEASRPKDGFLEINGILVPEADYAGACHGLASANSPSETCSLDVTEYVPVGPSTTTVVFRQLLGDNTPLQVQTITVVNENGAVLPIQPVSSELSSHYSTYYTFNLPWVFPTLHDLVLHVATNREALP